MVGLWMRRRTWALFIYFFQKKRLIWPITFCRVSCPLPIFINFLRGRQQNITSQFQPLFIWHTGPHSLHIFTQALYWTQNSFVYPSFLHVSVCDVLVSNVLGAPEYTLEFRTHYKTNRSIASFLCRTRGAREHMVVTPIIHQAGPSKEFSFDHTKPTNGSNWTHP